MEVQQTFANASVKHQSDFMRMLVVRGGDQMVWCSGTVPVLLAHTRECAHTRRVFLGRTVRDAPAQEPCNRFVVYTCALTSKREH